METTEQYRRSAEEALEEARMETDLRVRRAWLNIAGQWTALARARMETMGLQGHLQESQLGKSKAN